jgi:hypothetical protein
MTLYVLQPSAFIFLLFSDQCGALLVNCRSISVLYCSSVHCAVTLEEAFNFREGFLINL